MEALNMQISYNIMHIVVVALKAFVLLPNTVCCDSENLKIFFFSHTSVTTCVTNTLDKRIWI